MNAKSITLGLAVLWLVLVAASFVHTSVIKPEGFGINVIEVFLLWQVAALLAALVLLIVCLAAAPALGRGLRILGCVPIGLMAIFWGVIGVYIAFG